MSEEDGAHHRDDLEKHEKKGLNGGASPAGGLAGRRGEKLPSLGLAALQGKGKGKGSRSGEFACSVRM